MKKRFPPPSHRAIPTRDRKQRRKAGGETFPSKLSKKETWALQDAHEKGVRKAQELAARAKRERLVPINREKLSSCGLWASFGVETLEGKYYLDWPFTCVDCGSGQIWTGRQQKWWYEEAGGNIEQVALRCRACRIKERARRDAARKVHLHGAERKRVARTNSVNLKHKRPKRPGTW